MRRARLALVLATAVGAATLAACDALLTEPGVARAEVTLQLQLDEAPLGGTAAAFSRVRRVALRLVRPDSLFRDTVIPVVPAGGEIRVGLTIESDERIAGLGIAARLGTADDDLFQGGTIVGIVPGEPVRAEIPLLPVPALVDAAPDTVIFASILDTVALASSVLYASGDTVTGAFGLWTSADPAIVAVTPTGIAVALTPGQTVLETRLDTLFDTVVVQVPPPPVPEVVTWLSALGGNWSDGSNWSRGAPPIPGDSVRIDLPGTYTVVQDVAPPLLGELAVGNATGTQTLQASGRALNVPGGVALSGGGVLDLGAGASLTTAAAVTIGSGSSLELGDNATLTAPQVTIGAGGRLRTANLVTVTAAVDVTGLLLVDGGRATIDGALTTSAASTIRTGFSGTASRLVVPAGFVNLGAIQIGGGGQIEVGGAGLTNDAAATIDVPAGTQFGDPEIVGSWNNLGAITTARNLRMSSVGASYTNGGTIDVTATGWWIVVDADAFTTSGSFDVAGGQISMGFTGTGTGFTNTGAMTTQAGTFFQLDVGPFAQPTGSISGGGVLRLTGVTASLPAAVTLGTELPTFLQLESSTLSVPLLTAPSVTQLLLQTSTLTGDLDLTAGALAVVGAGTSTVDGTVTTSATSRITVEGGTLGDPTLSIPAGYTNNGITELTSSQAGSSATLAAPTMTNNLGGQVNTGGSQPGTFTIVGDVVNQNAFGLQQDLTVQGAFSDQGTFSTSYTGTGSALNVQGLNIFNASFDNVRVVSVGGTLSNFNQVTFSNMDPTVAQLSLAHPGLALGPFNMTGLVFNTVPTTGAYMSLNDSDGGPLFLTVNVLSSTPASGSALSLVSGGALLNW